MPRYSEEFKQEAIRLVREEGISLLQVSRIIGANHNTIREWVKKTESEDQSAKEYASEPTFRTSFNPILGFNLSGHKTQNLEA